MGFRANDALKKITKDEILQFYTKYFEPESKFRHELLVVVHPDPAKNTSESTEESTLAEQEKSDVLTQDCKKSEFSELLPETYIINDIDEFKKSLAQFPAITPEKHVVQKDTK